MDTPASTEIKAKEPIVALVILVTGTTVGDVILRKGKKLRLPKSQAEALANLNPPAAKITGI